MAKKHSSKRLSRKKKRPGAPPGTLEFIGDKQVEQPVVFQLSYNSEDLQEKQLADSHALQALPGYVNWFDVRGLHDVDLIEQFGRQFDIHPLVLEDVLNTQQRPKYEEYGKDGFIVLSSLGFDSQLHELKSEQIAIYFGENYLLSFQENEQDTFSAVRERLVVGRGRIRSRGSDYLAYALMDNLVDNYFFLLDDIEEQMAMIEDEIGKNPTSSTKEKIHHLKFQLLDLRKSVMPLREAVGRFSRSESPYVGEHTGIFVRDLYDHVIRISDLIETYRDMLNGLQDLYLSELSIRMNNVMQVLTIITTIFVPLSFLAGLYGMNFVNMPELQWEHGYYYLLGLMGMIVVASLLYFKKKDWI